MEKHKFEINTSSVSQHFTFLSWITKIRTEKKEYIKAIKYILKLIKMLKLFY